MASENKTVTDRLTYAKAGVDIDAGNSLVEAIKPLARSTSRPGTTAGLGGFGALFDLKAAGFQDPILVAANDGVGTKVKIAIEAGLHETIGIDLVAMCVNDLIVQGAEPLFFLDYFACSRLDVDAARTVIAGVAEGCRQAGTALIGGETAEMPGLYASDDYDLAGFAVGAAERGKLLPRQDIGPGDMIIGLASSGLHSNGFSLVRRLIADECLDWGMVSPFKKDQTLAKSLLAPTKIYVKPVLSALKQTAAIKALAHITGGGLSENLPRVLPKTVTAEIDLRGLAIDEVFHWIAQTGQIAEKEMLRTFNCGIGMTVICAEAEADEVCRVFQDHGERCLPIGKLVPRDGEETVRFSGSLFRGAK